MRVSLPVCNLPVLTTRGEKWHRHRSRRCSRGQDILEGCAWDWSIAFADVLG